MRVGCSIIFINGYCYQSYNWKIIRPLGALNNVLSFLDSYEVDEISITRPIRADYENKSYESDIEIIKKSCSNSPISFGGGIRNLHQLKYLKGLPIERFHFSNAFIHLNKNLIQKSINMFGSQAIVASLPLKIIKKVPYVFDGISGNFVYLSKEIFNFVSQYADEIILIDTDNEGLNDVFNFDLLELANFPTNKIIISGGLGPKVIKKAKSINIASCLIENKVLHKENFIKREL
tara:strand:- start:1404 stop:2105 length:702 start_codon:yes stop_codon:yes gene_type:complete